MIRKKIPKMRKATVVLTTIFDPVILDDYFDNFSRYGHLDKVQVIVIPDKKTPPAAYETCRRLAARGMDTLCPNLEEQEDFLKRLELRPALIPHNTDNRRNVGFLMALENGSEMLISIDDDNYCRPGEDFYKSHSDALFTRKKHAVAGNETSFLNICELLEFSGPATPYPRGFPYSARHKHVAPRISEREANVMINAGLWLQDPDVDAITWLGLRPCVRGFKGNSLVLDDDTWCPVNSQNTALIADLIPSYYFIRMGYSINGTPVDRYGDIFSGYFALACAKHLSGTARFGTPVADHRRNRHDYLRDATAEWHAILLLEDILAWLVDQRLQGSDCAEAYLSLAAEMQDAVEKFTGSIWTDAAKGFFHQMAHFMREWIGACRTIAG